jgi:GTPase SAR1 family protein
MEFTLNSLAKTLGKPIDKDLVRRRKDCFAQSTHSKKKYITAISLPESSPVTTLILNEEAAHLEYLYANSVKKLQKIDFQSFATLKYADLSNCNLAGDVILRCTESNLKQIYLQNNKIDSIRFIGNFPKLQLIDICKNQLKSIAFEGHFNNLHYLYLNDNQLITIDLSNLNALKTLHLAGNQFRQITYDFAQSSLEILRLANNPLPNYIMGFTQANDENCLESIRNYYAGLDKGAVLDNEYKVLLIGNGNVGKSCMVERLVHNQFQKVWDSTHGISLKRFEHEHFKESYLFNLWDFGGQDIYHATHRLFLQTNALYLILWDLHTEKSDYTSCDEDGQTHQYENHKLPYWLDYAKSQGKKSPMMVIQTKAAPNTSDTLDAQAQIGKIAQNYKQSVEYLVFKSVDSSIEDADLSGYNCVLSAMRAAIKSKGNQINEIPVHWAKLRQNLRNLQEKGEKTMDVEAYLTLAADFEAKEALDILNNLLVFTGVVYYKEGYFANKVILDQAWAIHAVYTLFRRKTEKGKRNRTYYDIQQAQGRFTGADLGDIWGDDYAVAEQTLFVDFMLSCNLCFETTPRAYPQLEDAQIRQLPFDKRHFIAPQMMCEDMPKSIEDSYLNKTNNWYLTYEHAFLHYGIMQSFIVKTQYLAELREIWQLGIFLHENGHYALVKCTKQTIYVRVTHGGTVLLDKIRNLLDELQKDVNIREKVSFNGENYCFRQDVEAHPSENQLILDVTGQLIPFSGFEIFKKTNPSVQFSEKDAAKNNSLKMTFQDLQESVRKEVATATIDEAIELVENWATTHNDKGLKNFIAQCAGEWKTLKRDKLMGITDRAQILHHSQAITNKLLNIQDVSDLE